MTDASRRKPGPDAPCEVRPISGEPFFLAIERTRVSTETQARIAARHWSLPPRPAEVLALVIDGKTNREIAAELHCAERTVEIHVGATFDRAQVDNRATLVARALTVSPHWRFPTMATSSPRC